MQHAIACEICYSGDENSEPAHVQSLEQAAFSCGAAGGACSDGHDARVHFSPTGEVHIRIGKLTLIERSSRNGPAWSCEHGGVQVTRATAREALEAVL